MKTVQKHFKNNEKNEKIMKRFGSRTSTLARGLRPVQVVYGWPEDFDPKTGKHNGETQRENDAK